MTTNTHDVQRKQAEHDELSNDLQTYLDSGKMIEILGPTPIKHHHPRDYKYASDKS